VEPKRRGRHEATGRTAFGHRLTLVLALAGVVTVASELPAVTTEPFFLGVNTIVVLSFAGLGFYLASEHVERTTGACFIGAGAGWVVLNLDVHHPWGAAVSWVLGATALGTSLGWGILRYGRARLDPGSRWWVAATAIGTAGSAVAVALVSRPEQLGFAPAALWPTTWPDQRSFLIARAVHAVVWLGLGLWFARIARRLLRSALPVQRRVLRPLAWASAGWGATVVAVTGAAVFLPELMTRHACTVVVGLMWVKVTVAVAALANRNRMLAVTFVDTLPRERTPQALTGYVRAALSDPTAELLYVVPDRGYLIDDGGRPREVTRDRLDQRFTEMIYGPGGQRVALLLADPRLREDPTAVRSFARVLSIVAENQQLHAMQQMRLMQLGALRTAEQLAFERAREQFRRDLHDGVQQTIAAARIDLEGILDTDEHAPVELAVADLDGKLKLALEQIRNLKRGGLPPELSSGLGLAVERTISELRINASTRIGDEQLGVLTVPVYYLVREALTNTHKHARCAAAQVLVAKAGDCVEVTVRDNGAGGATVRPGGGLAGLRDRVVELGGRLDVHSPPGAGTTLHAVIPVVAA
jgi:signal transduction histidine kinase